MTQATPRRPSRWNCLEGAEYAAYLRSRCIETEDGCWLWQGSKKASGYGQVTYQKQPRTVHRLMFSLVSGPIPDGLHVLHRCDRPSCCAPAHLWAGTQTENLRDSVAKGRHERASQTHCKHGHELTEANTYRRPGKPEHRACVTCRAAKNAHLRAATAARKSDPRRN